MKTRIMRPRAAGATRLAAALLSLLFILSLQPPTSAQESRGKITGTVSDPNKAAVPGASVKVTDAARGTSVTLTANANEVIASYVPPSDITQEFKVQTATFDAQFGNTEGGVTSIVIKSGTNDFHGTAYYWTEPGGMAANDFFGNSRGQGRTFTYSNRPGFSIGGPVWIPKLYNGKNKTF